MPNQGKQVSCKETSLKSGQSCLIGFRNGIRSGIKFEDHRRVHHGAPPLQCLFVKGCDRTFNIKYQLDDHIKYDHRGKERPKPKLNIVICEKRSNKTNKLCIESLPNGIRRDKLDAHNRRHHGADGLPCTFDPPCEKTFADPMAVKDHVQSEHLHLQLVCGEVNPDGETICSTVFTYEKGLRDHKRVQHKPGHYVCQDQVCDDVEPFANLAALYHHRHVHHTEHKSCPDCGKTFYKLDVLRVHHLLVHLLPKAAFCVICKTRLYDDEGFNFHWESIFHLKKQAKAIEQNRYFEEQERATLNELHQAATTRFPQYAVIHTIRSHVSTTATSTTTSSSAPAQQSSSSHQMTLPSLGFDFGQDKDAVIVDEPVPALGNGRLALEFSLDNFESKYMTSSSRFGTIKLSGQVALHRYHPMLGGPKQFIDVGDKDKGFVRFLIKGSFSERSKRVVYIIADTKLGKFYAGQALSVYKRIWKYENDIETCQAILMDAAQARGKTISELSRNEIDTFAVDEEGKPYQNVVKHFAVNGGMENFEFNVIYQLSEASDATRCLDLIEAFVQAEMENAGQVLLNRKIEYMDKSKRSDPQVAKAAKAAISRQQGPAYDGTLSFVGSHTSSNDLSPGCSTSSSESPEPKKSRQQ